MLETWNIKILSQGPTDQYQKWERDKGYKEFLVIIMYVCFQSTYKKVDPSALLVLVKPLAGLRLFLGLGERWISLPKI